VRAVNLIPADQRRGATVGLGRSQGGAYALLAIVGMLALFGVLYGKASHQISSTRGQLAAVSARVAQAQSDASSLASYEALDATRERRLTAVEDLMNSRFDWATVMHEFARVLPTHVSIGSLTGAIGSAAGAAAPAPSASASGTAAAAAVTSATPPGSIPTFTLAGCASTKDEVAEALQRLRLIGGVKEVTLQSASEGTLAGSSASGAGSCNSGTTFAASVVFSPLPQASAYPAAKTVADPSVTAAPKTSGRTK
jgi:Tfp pilus assembly protein PilN